MPHQTSESKEVNYVYISQVSGGIGGTGGSGGQEGGGGGVGEGPNFRAANMHLVIQNQLSDTRLRPSPEAGGSAGGRRELPGAMRNLRHMTEATSTSREHSSRSSPPLMGFNGEDRASGRVSLLRQPMLAFRKATRFLAPLRIRSSISANHGPPQSEPRFPHPINQAGLGEFSSQPSRDHQSNWSSDESFLAFDRSRLPQPTRSILGGTFITAETVNHRQGETGMNILHRAVALEALYDSADSFPQPRCHPETRTKMLNGLYNWAIKDHDSRTRDEDHNEDEENTADSDEEEDEKDDEQEPDIRVCRPICWLHGPAGAGKSAIMQTLCQRLQNTGRLGGAFFFKRGHGARGSAKVLFATLAYQLALNNRNLNPPISQSMEYDPSIVGRSMDVQLQKLIVIVISCLARDFLRLIRRVGTGDVPLKTCSNMFTYPWGQLIRCSHSSPELLQDLYEFVPPWESFPSSNGNGKDCLCSVEFHNVVQWLKEHPDPPLELIERWQSFLTKSEDLCTHRHYEAGWQKRPEFGVIDLNEASSPVDEEEFARAWEEELENSYLEDISWCLEPLRDSQA